LKDIRSNNVSLKYQRFTSKGCKDIGFKKTEFLAKTQFLLRKTKMLTWNLQNKKSKEQENVFYVCIMAELCWADDDIHFLLKFYFLQLRDVEIFSYFCTWQLLKKLNNFWNNRGCISIRSNLWLGTNLWLFSLILHLFKAGSVIEDSSMIKVWIWRVYTVQYNETL